MKNTFHRKFLKNDFESRNINIPDFFNKFKCNLFKTNYDKNIFDIISPSESSTRNDKNKDLLADNILPINLLKNNRSNQKNTLLNYVKWKGKGRRDKNIERI